MNQKQKILEHINRVGSITPLEALNLFGCLRLAARINDLKREGVEISTDRWITPGGANVAIYKLG